MTLRQFLTARRADLPPPFHKHVDVLLRSLKPGFEDAVTEIDRASREEEA